MKKLSKIVFPEGNDTYAQEFDGNRILGAAKIAIDEQLFHPVIIGECAEITAFLGENDQYTAVEAQPSGDALIQGAELVRDGHADAIVAGAVYATPDVLRAYFKTLGIKDNVTRVTSCFLIEKGEQRYLFADCGVNPNPSAEVLAEFAYLCSEFALLVDIEPRVAFISYSTLGSAEGSDVDLMREALRITHERYPSVIADGELQLDAAVNLKVAAVKAPESTVAGKATILIFKDLSEANSNYKNAQQLGGFESTGPILLGTDKVAQDVSRNTDAAGLIRSARIALLQLGI